MSTFAEQIVEKLTSFPHRAVASDYEKPTSEYLKSIFGKNIAKEQPFRTHRNYLVTIYWLILGMITGILLTIFYSWIGTIIVAFFTYSALTYFNWYASPVSYFPPIVETKNIYVKEPTQKRKRVLLMAHYDTAPISVLYSPKMVGNFRQSLIINQVILLITAILSAVYIFYANAIVTYLLFGIAGYFVIQLIVASFDFFRFGYSNGASDNATGVAAAIATYHVVKDKNLDNVAVDVLLTGAEEVGMIGAKAFYEKYKNELQDTYVLNFDTLGSGTLRIITETGSLTSIRYDNLLSELSQSIVYENPKYKHITTGAWHTADFDSVWFNRAGIPTLTLAALDNNGRMPNIHRETDTLQRVDFQPMHDAINLAVEIISKLDKIS